MSRRSQPRVFSLTYVIPAPYPKRATGKNLPRGTSYVD
jgi:hypothetical protein